MRSVGPSLESWSFKTLVISDRCGLERGLYCSTGRVSYANTGTGK